MRHLHTFDEHVARAILSLPAWCTPPFLVITLFGSPAVTMTIGAGFVLAGYLRSSWRLAIAGGGVWLTIGLNTVIKSVVERDRPTTDYALSMPLRTHSFPSGHATGSMVAYGLVAYVAWRLLPQPWNYVAVTGLATLILLIGVSRVYLGAHFPSDVVVGWLLGAVMLTVIILVVRPLG